MRICLIALLALFLATPAMGGDMPGGDLQTFAFIYFMQAQPEEVGKAVPLHVEYWETMELGGYRGGPFGDYSGGMIVFQAQNAELARQLVEGDPFVKNRLVGDNWLKAWRAQ